MESTLLERELENLEKRKAPITVMGTLAPFFKYILKVIPEHKTWVEPFGGPCEVLFEKERAAKEVLNDIDSKNIGFFRALKSLSEADIDWLEKQDWVRRRATFDKLKKMQKLTPKERVYRRVYMGACGLHMVKGEPDSYRAFFEGKPINVWRRLRNANKRLKGVSIHNEDFEKVIKKYDSPGTFFYCDPPFYSTEKYYSHTLDKEGLDRLIKTLKGTKGKFVCWNTACATVIKEVKKAGFNYRILKKEAFVHRIDPTKKKWNYFIFFGNVSLKGSASQKGSVKKVLPAPSGDESKNDFIARFMTSPKVLEEFPNRSQRYAVAVSAWEKTLTKAIPGSASDDSSQSIPALEGERREGSSKNPKGSASTEGGKIELSASTNKALQTKLDSHNDKVGKDKSKLTDLRSLQAVYRRGAGAFSTSHRPGMTRAQWAFARVNHFLHLLETGKPKDSKYVTDNDLLPSSHPALEKAEGFVPPKNVRDAAAKGLELRREWDRGGLSVQQAAEEGVGSGVQRAVNLKNGDSISKETLKMMRGFFARHEKNNQPSKKMPDGGPTAGTIAWLLWGGDPGRAWANKLLEEIEMEKADPKHFGGGQNIDVFGYKTKNFDICRSAVVLFKKLGKTKDEITQKHVVKAAKYLDTFFGIEKKVVEADLASSEDGEAALDLAILFAYEVGIVAERMSRSFDRDIAFVKMHFYEIGSRMNLEKSAPNDAQVEVLEKRLGLWGSTAGKTRISKRVVKMIPDHETYIEPFAGGAAVFYAKPKDMSKKEVLADINPELAFSFKFARDATPEQVAALKKKNWVVTRAALKKAHLMDPTTAVDRFYRFTYKRGASFFRVDRNITGIDPAKEGKKLTIADRIEKTKERLSSVSVYNSSYEKLFSKYDSKTSFFYLDPPYPRRTMEVGEKDFDEDKFIENLKRLKGKFILHYDAKDKKKFEGKGWNVKTISVFRTGGFKEATKVGKLLEVTNYKQAKKSELSNKSDVSWEMPIMKVDEDERLVTGIVLEPNEVDAQNDTVSVEAIKEAAYKFLSRYNKGTQLGFMHKAFGNLGISLVESWLARDSAPMNGTKVKKGSWLMTVHVKNEKLWERIKEGKVTGFSIGGVARVS